MFVALVWILSDFGDDFTLATIQENAVNLREQVNAHYLLGVLSFISVYVFVNIWFPAAAILTLLSGFLYGTVLSVIYVDTATTLGALFAFWISRSFAGNWIQHKWHRQLIGFNRKVSEGGYVYLLLVRLIPLMPYILVNFLAGLTKVRVRTFIWTTALGSFPGILVFSYAGRHLLSIKSVEQVFTSKVIIAFVLLAVFAGLILFIKTITDKKLNGDT